MDKGNDHSKEKHLIGAPLKQVHAILENTRLGIKATLGTNTLAFRLFVSDEEKSFVTYDYRFQF